MISARLVVIDEWHGKFVVNDSYRIIAEELHTKFKEITVPVKSILFVDNTESTGKHKNKIKYAQISTMPERWKQIIYQLTGKNFSYVMEFFKINTQDMSAEQIILTVYHELRHVDSTGEVISHDIEDWQNMHYKLGPDWASTKRLLPNLLDKHVDWDSISRPNLFSISGARVDE